MITLETVEEAKKQLHKFIKKTDVIYGYHLSQLLKNDVYLKLENLQLSGSFKIRGAGIKILSLTDSQKEKGVIAASAGNHAQGVAIVSSHLKINAIIVMPQGAPITKISATREYGAKVIIHGKNFDEALLHAKKLAKKEDMTLIHAFDDEKVITGQATIGLEIFEEIPDIDQVIIPVGGGGLIGGVGSVLKQLNPKIKIIGVQSQNVQGMKHSLDSKKISSFKNATPTIADGIAVKKPGKLTFSYAKKVIDKIVTVNEEEIAEAILFLLEKCKLVTEGAGATTVAALLNKKIDVENKKTCVLISGGNIDINIMERIINAGLVKQNRRFVYSVTIKDSSDQLRQLLSIISDSHANLISVSLSRYDYDLHINERKAILTIETFDAEHKQKIIENIENFKKTIIHGR